MAVLGDSSTLQNPSLTQFTTTLYNAFKDMGDQEHVGVSPYSAMVSVTEKAMHEQKDLVKYAVAMQATGPRPAHWSYSNVPSHRERTGTKSVMHQMLDSSHSQRWHLGRGSAVGVLNDELQSKSEKKIDGRATGIELAKRSLAEVRVAVRQGFAEAAMSVSDDNLDDFHYAVGSHNDASVQTWNVWRSQKCPYEGNKRNVHAQAKKELRDLKSTNLRAWIGSTLDARPWHSTPSN